MCNPTSLLRLALQRGTLPEVEHLTKVPFAGKAGSRNVSIHIVSIHIVTDKTHCSTQLTRTSHFSQFDKVVKTVFAANRFEILLEPFCFLPGFATSYYVETPFCVPTILNKNDQVPTRCSHQTSPPWPLRILPLRHLSPIQHGVRASLPQWAQMPKQQITTWEPSTQT